MYIIRCLLFLLFFSSIYSFSQTKEKQTEVIPSYVGVWWNTQIAFETADLKVSPRKIIIDSIGNCRIYHDEVEYVDYGKPKEEERYYYDIQTSLSYEFENMTQKRVMSFFLTIQDNIPDTLTYFQQYPGCAIYFKKQENSVPIAK